MSKLFKAVGAILLLAIAVLVYAGWASDIPHATLAEKYATGASDFIDLPSGARAHYRLQGNDEGPKILLLHGSNASLHTWEGWVEELEDTYFIATVDLPGHGLTGATPNDDYTYGGMVQFLQEFTTAIGFDRFFLGGNSMGGGISLSYALTFPKQLNGLILVDAAGIDLPPEAQDKVDFPIAFQLAGRWYSDWLFENVTPRSIVRDGLIKSVTNQAVVTEEAIDLYWELARHPGNRRATGKRFVWYREGRTALPVDQINLPTLILWGEDDKLIPVDVAHEMHKRIKGSQLRIFRNMGHIPMEEYPAETAAAAKVFLSGQPLK